jgi:hypothetical protein
VVPRARLLWAIVVSSLLLTGVRTAELVAIIGPAAVVLLAQPAAFVLVAGLVMVALTHLPLVGLRQHRRDPRRVGEPSWPEWCASWSVGRAPEMGAVHGRDGPGSRARRL